MWRPATKQITGTNDSTSILIIASCHIIYIPFTVPLGGNRRRFGPAPVEESAPPQLAQPSPSAYPRPRDDARAKEESPSAGGTPTPGKSTVTYLVRCIVHIGDSITLHYSWCTSECP
jgi:splicing factor 1